MSNKSRNRSSSNREKLKVDIAFKSQGLTQLHHINPRGLKAISSSKSTLIASKSKTIIILVGSNFKYLSDTNQTSNSSAFSLFKPNEELRSFF
jgi:hypothetical protein